MNKTAIAAVLVAVGVLCCWPALSSAQASSLIPYPNRGVENPATYTFTAIADGAVTAYFAGSAAGFSEVVGMTVNGVPTGITGLNDHSSQIGDALVLGSVHAGDTIVFFDQVSTQNTGDIWYSNPVLNPVQDGQHVYSTLYDGLSDSILHVPAGVIPAGVYVGFEDLRRAQGSNFDYLDEAFVVTNVATDATPLPASLPLFATGLGGLALLRWRRKRKSSSIVVE